MYFLHIKYIALGDDVENINIGKGWRRLEKVEKVDEVIWGSLEKVGES